MIEINSLVRERARQLGPPGEHWVAALPGLLAEMEQRWSITTGPPLSGGSAAYVAPARMADGRDAVLKLVVPDPDLTGQVRTMVEADGRGYARVYASDVEQHAMLIEALGPSLEDLRLAPEHTIDALCGTLRRAWQVAPWPGLTADPAREKARALHGLVSRLWEQLGAPCPERVVAQALDYADRRAAAFRRDRCVVVHGDPHPGNILRAPTPRVGAESGYAFIDPDGFLADPAYDLGVVLRDWCAELNAGDPSETARRYSRQLASRTGVDETAIWEWGYLERVSTGLYLTQLGAAEWGRSFLATADRLVSGSRASSGG
ncbi:MAG TPA: aminoglycoside phosphotransferase family protein [Micromonosporaceae bacterium]|nr:aminoglycoside phosphotransferase family protein [Micromonosporaceae bacterium]